MGVKGLLPCLQGTVSAQSIGSYRGTRVAIDASGWLHKGLYSIAEDYVDSGFNDSQFYVDYIVTRARSLRDAGVEPVLVFDGRRNYLKSETQAKREESRLNNIEQGRRLIDSMQATADTACRQKLRLEAISSFQKGLGVTHEMEIRTIAALRKLCIEVIISPYEADAQLAHLCQIGFCDSVLTEDSDILVYSAICGIPFNVFYKFDRVGAVQVINFGDINLIGANSDSESDALDLPVSQSSDDGSSSKNNKSSSKSASKEEKSFLPLLKNFKGPSGRRMFAQMCILAGCDYSESIFGVGIIAAQKAVLRFKSCADDERLLKVCSHLRSTGKKVSDEYLARVLRAEVLFHYHPVYNPLTKAVEHFMPHNAAVSYSRKSRVSSSRAKMGASSSSPSLYGSSNDGWCGPTISDVELAKLGTESEILKAAPSDMKISEICEGKFSFKTFESITPQFPWDDPQLSRQAPGKPSTSQWNIRRNLVQATAGLSAKLSTSIGLPQQLPCNNWNRGHNKVQFARHQPYSQPYRQTAPNLLNTSPSAVARNSSGNIDTGSSQISWKRPVISDARTGTVTVSTPSLLSHSHSMMARSFNLPVKSTPLPSSPSSSSSTSTSSTPIIQNSNNSSSSGRLSISATLNNTINGIVKRDIEINLINDSVDVGGTRSTPIATHNAFDFYSQTETDAEENVLDLSSSPERTSDSDNGAESDSPDSEEGIGEGKGDGSVRHPISMIGGIAEGVSTRAAIELECVGVSSAVTVSGGDEESARGKRHGVPRLPPTAHTAPSSAGATHTHTHTTTTTTNSSNSSSGFCAGSSTPHTSINTYSNNSRHRCSLTGDADALSYMAMDCSPGGTDSETGSPDASATPANPVYPAKTVNKDSLSSGIVNAVDEKRDRSASPGGKENCAASVNHQVCVDIRTGRDGGSKSPSRLEAAKVSAVDVKTLGASIPSSHTVQGVKRKLYDTVAIVSDMGKGGKGKRPKSTMKVASIMSFFTPR